ncbi:MAG: repeat protein [Frankiales bacterium]|nr:repeat protein [Frankiales bacterium]
MPTPDLDASSLVGARAWELIGRGSRAGLAEVGARRLCADDIASLRTAFSRTYRNPDGTFQARFWQEPGNYQVGDEWRPIDTTLDADASGDLSTTAAPTTVELPASLDDPAKVTAGGRWVSFRLQGADGDVAPDADGSSASYVDAIDGADVSYDAQATGVKETLTLPDASARSTYRYAIDASSGLTPHLEASGAVVFTDASRRYAQDRRHRWLGD